MGSRRPDGHAEVAVDGPTTLVTSYRLNTANTTPPTRTIVAPRRTMLLPSALYRVAATQDAGQRHDGLPRRGTAVGDRDREGDRGPVAEEHRVPDRVVLNRGGHRPGDQVGLGQQTVDAGARIDGAVGVVPHADHDALDAHS